MEIKKPYYLSIFFPISIGLYISSLFFPYNINIYSGEPEQMPAFVHVGGWIGFFLILISLIMLFSHKFKTVKILCLIGTLSMTLSLTLLSIYFSFGYWIPTFSFYLFVVSVIINIILTILTMMLPKSPKIIKFKLNKVAKVGIYFLMITVGTLFINFIMPTSTSYAFILFLFPIELVISLILVIVGMILSFHRKSGESP